MDHQVFATQQYGGVSRYFIELARTLKRRSDVRPEILGFGYCNAFISKGDPLHKASFGWVGPSRGVRFRPKLLKPLVWGAVRAGQPHVLHETGYSDGLVELPSTVARVTTLHDMIVELFPDYFDHASQRMESKLAALRRSDAIICISQSTETDLLERYPEFYGRTKVVHHGVLQQPTEGARPECLPSNYLLYVGTRQTYKNFANLVRALGSASGLPTDLKLVCFGGGAFATDDLRVLAESGWSRDRVVQLAGDDALLALAYRHARLFVFPSLYEGFGMPLTEAMVQGCPIACARASCFPEVCGDSAAYFDGQNVEDIRACLEDLFARPHRLTELSCAGRARVGLFTWERCAEQTVEAYRLAIAVNAQRTGL
jgi:glycosyltransferase involved in cell wall biosynthesis